MFSRSGSTLWKNLEMPAIKKEQLLFAASVLNEAAPIKFECKKIYKHVILVPLLLVPRPIQPQVEIVALRLFHGFAGHFLPALFCTILFGQFPIPFLHPFHHIFC